MMPFITVVTPLFNRAKLVEKLYDSLKKQSLKDFVWLIIDDGSTDHPDQEIEKWQRENEISIIYVKQNNGGKHRALNKGIPLIRTALTFIVDSDDYLPEKSIEIIKKYHDQYLNMEGICGYSFLRCYEDGTVNTAEFPVDEKIESFREARINGNLGGDKAEVFFTEILKRYPFPEFENEKFVPEDVVWMQMSQKYLMVHINQCVYICEYLEGGLTKSGRGMKINSPKGMILRSQIYLADPKVNMKPCIKMMLLYIIYGKFDGRTIKLLFKESHRKSLFLFLLLPGIFLYMIWKKKLK